LSLTDLLPARPEPNSQLLLWRISALAWAALMFYLSTATFGKGMSRWLLARALAVVHLTLSPLAFAVVHVVCRKLAHLTEYGIFSLILYRSLPTQGSLGGRRQRAFLCVLAAAAYSLTDEFHQLFVVGRHASVTDCAIDSVGAALAMVLAFACRRILSNRQGEERSLA
jgi:VanZ family protein